MSLFKFILQPSRLDVLKMQLVGITVIQVMDVGFQELMLVLKC